MTQPRSGAYSAQPTAADTLTERFVDLVCADPDLLDAEFAALIAANCDPPARRRGAPPPSARPRHAPAPPRPAAGVATDDDQWGVRARSRARSPPTAQSPRGPSLHQMTDGTGLTIPSPPGPVPSSMPEGGPRP